MPEVNYSDVEEFLTLQRLFIAEYSALITETFDSAFHVPQGTSSLTWTSRDMICHGCATFPKLGLDGAKVVRIMTKGRGVLWSLKTSEWLADMVSTACRSCARALITWPRYSETLSAIYGRTLKQEMLCTMHDSLFVFDSLYKSSFVFVEGQRSFTAREWREIMLAFAMITHERLAGAHVWQVDSALIRDILLCIPETHANADSQSVLW